LCPVRRWILYLYQFRNMTVRDFELNQGSHTLGFLNHA
jgi:hypothetical protein